MDGIGLDWIGLDGWILLRTLVQLEHLAVLITDCIILAILNDKQFFGTFKYNSCSYLAINEQHLLCSVEEKAKTTNITLKGKYAGSTFKFRTNTHEILKF